MALSAQLKEILACPKCKGELEFHEEKQQIHCKGCRLVYRIEDDIPVMLLEQAQALSE
ncbi:MAG: Trm112 family protein [Deltaproteobacteria bacterium]|nr:Trm112 family protein [Deltaproteobacteria bacterium]